MNATLLSAALLCLMAPPVESAGAPQTLLYVRTMPSGAQILLDGKPLGTSDGLFPVQPGQYKIVVDLEGHEPQKQDITVRDGRITRIELTLAKGPAAGSATPKSKPGKAEPLSFGPTIERVVSDDRAGKDWFIDLDKGVLHTPPAELDKQRKPEQMLQWARREGIDASGVKASEGFLFGIDLQVAAIDGASWDNVDPARVAAALGRGPNTPVKEAKDQPAVMVGGAGQDASVLYGFRTREGGMGVLQVIGVTADPKGLKIRYKLLQGTPQLAPRKVHLSGGPSSRPMVLDLASGETFNLPPAAEKDPKVLVLTGKGDIALDRGLLYCLRGARAEHIAHDFGTKPLEIEDDESEKGVMIYRLPPVLPAHLVVFTAEKKPFVVTILSAPQPPGLGGELEYRPAQRDPRDRGQPKETVIKTVRLAEVETRDAEVVLDLATGQTLKTPDRKSKEGLAQFARLGKGDLFFVRSGVRWSLACLRGATAMRWGDADRLVPLAADKHPDPREPVTSYELPQVPCRLRVFTPEKKQFDLIILAITKDNGIDLEYWLAADPTTVPEPAKKIHLPGADTRGAQVVLDLASGQMLAPDRKEGVAGFARLGKGDLFFVRGSLRWSLGCLRGAKAMRWDGGQLAPLAEPMRRGMSAYKLSQVPCRLLVTTAEKKRFDVTILAVSKDGGIDVEYQPAADMTTVPEPKR